jgi:hypothetical protein
MQELFPAAVYLLCFITSSTCALLLWRNYARTSARLLLWSGLCFLFLAANNLVVIIDLLVIRDVDFAILRLLLSLAAVGILLFGFIWDLERE